MNIGDIIESDSRIYLKSEFGPVSDDWPALSFSRSIVGNRLRAAFNPLRDLVIYVGTGNPETTENPDHRRRLLSAIRVDPHTIYDTRDLVPSEIWEWAQTKYKGRWDKSFPVLQAWEMLGFPSAPEALGGAYSRLGFMENRGNVVELEAMEKEKLLSLPISELSLKVQPIARKATEIRELKNLEFDLRRFLGILRDRLKERARVSGTESSRTNPHRFLDAEIDMILNRKWQEQKGKCALCDGQLTIYTPKNRLLQGSVDRIDSACSWYNETNLQITHLGCNLAKNDCSTEQFEEWLGTVRTPFLHEINPEV